VPFDELLAARVRGFLGRRRGLVEKKMFGGLAFLLKGNLLAAVWKESLIVRLDRAEWEAAIREPHAGEFDATGRSMKGWVLLRPEGLRDEIALGAWLERALAFVGKLPSK
jgi:hypothetical protein